MMTDSTLSQSNFIMRDIERELAPDAVAIAKEILRAAGGRNAQSDIEEIAYRVMNAEGIEFWQMCRLKALELLGHWLP